MTYTFQLLHDLIESNGNEIVVQASKSFQPGKTVTLTPSIGFTYQDEKLVDYYYGVQSNEVQPGRPKYQGKGAMNYNVTLNANLKVTKHIELLGQLKYEVLGSGITDSPIINEKNIYFFTVGAVYRF